MTSSASNRKHAFSWLELYILNSPLHHSKESRSKGKYDIKIFSNSQYVPNENRSDLEIAFGTIYSYVWDEAPRAGWPPQPWAHASGFTAWGAACCKLPDFALRIILCVTTQWHGRTGGCYAALGLYFHLQVVRLKKDSAEQWTCLIKGNKHECYSLSWQGTERLKNQTGFLCGDLQSHPKAYQTQHKSFHIAGF